MIRMIGLIGIEFPVTGKWQDEGAYAEIAVPAEIPAGAILRLHEHPHGSQRRKRREAISP